MISLGGLFEKSPPKTLQKLFMMKRIEKKCDDFSLHFLFRCAIIIEEIKIKGVSHDKVPLYIFILQHPCLFSLFMGMLHHICSSNPARMVYLITSFDIEYCFSDIIFCEKEKMSDHGIYANEVKAK